MCLYFFHGSYNVLSVLDLLCSKKASGSAGQMAKVPSGLLVMTLRKERKYLHENLNLG